MFSFKERIEVEEGSDLVMKSSYRSQAIIEKHSVNKDVTNSMRELYREHRDPDKDVGPLPKKAKS